MPTIRYLDDFFGAYKACAAWSSTDGDNESLEAFDFADETLHGMREDGRAFITEAQATGYLDECKTAEQAGHDFWLTRCGHGVGFWDRGLGDAGDRLTERCDVWGTVDLYLGDDGLIYAS
jgi:hypothetical protein